MSGDRAALLLDADAWRTRALAAERERDEWRRLLEVAQAELRPLRELRDRVISGALDALGHT